ncbi:MAG: hypothetical protein LBQ22_07465 [Bacteroidales bacterium]|jgi:O-antigen/teichoic acid export membrane protein|nr:hypothetical protein [Bacteroidales bacterium]
MSERNRKRLVSILKNKVLHYIFSRYATYLVQFVNSLLIAAYLGPYYLGIWGFITLIIQYLNQMNLGISHSVNAIIAIHKHKEWYAQKVIGASISMLICLACLVVLFFVANELFLFEIGSKYGFSKYAPMVAAIGILGYFNTLFCNIFRIYGRLLEIAFSQTVFPVLMLLAILLFKGESLLWALTITNLLAIGISFGLFVVRVPVKIKPLFIPRLFKAIQIKGWYLFVYNASFYMILISTRSFVSSYYSVSEFGYFTFAFTLAHAVLLLLDSFSFIIYPKLLNRLASASIEKISALLAILRNTYITTSHLLVHTVILFFPLFLLFFPQYEESKQAFRLIALTLALYASSFGYSGLLIAKEEEKKLSYAALGALVINIATAWFLTAVLSATFAQIIIATMLAYLFFVFVAGYMGSKHIKLPQRFFPIINNIFPSQLLAPCLLTLCLTIFQVGDIYFIAPLLLFVIFNHKAIVALKNISKIVAINANLINI